MAMAGGQETRAAAATCKSGSKTSNNEEMECSSDEIGGIRDGPRPSTSLTRLVGLLRRRAADRRPRRPTTIIERVAKPLQEPNTPQRRGRVRGRGLCALLADYDRLVRLSLDGRGDG